MRDVFLKCNKELLFCILWCKFCVLVYVRKNLNMMLRVVTLPHSLNQPPSAEGFPVMGG